MTAVKGAVDEAKKKGGEMGFLGVDLHSDRFVVARAVFEGETMSTRMETHTFEGKSYQGFLESLKKDDYVLIESSTNSFWFHDQLADRVKACYVYDVNKGRAEGNKTDKIDARKLAKKLTYYVLMGGTKDDLPTVYVPAPKVRELRGLFSIYGLYKKIKTQLKNRMHSVLKQNGICVGRKELDRLDFPLRVEGFAIAEIWKVQLRSLLKEKENTEEEQEKIKGRIYALGNELFPQEIKLLLSIKGFSPLTAIALMSDVVEVERFSSAKKFCSYLRVVPKITASNKTVHLGAINKKSRSTTCSLLTQSVRPTFPAIGRALRQREQGPGTRPGAASTLRGGLARPWETCQGPRNRTATDATRTLGRRSIG